MVTIAYGIQLLERERRNAADRYHFNGYSLVSDHKHLTVWRLFNIFVKNVRVKFSDTSISFENIEHCKFPNFRYYHVAIHKHIERVR